MATTVDRPPTTAASPELVLAGDERPVRIGWIESLALFVVFGVGYALLGYQVVTQQHVVVFDALDRAARGLMVWHNDPPKLAAVGFVFPPMTTLAFLPVALVKPLVSSLVALPLTSAVFGAGTVVVLARTLARCAVPPIARLAIVVAFGLSPLWVFYATNGMGEVVYLFFLAVALYGLVSWFVTAQPRYLIAASIAFAFLVVSRYAFLWWAALVAILIAVALARRPGQENARNEVEGSVITFLAPVVYATALWILFSWVITGDPFGWTSDSRSQVAVNSAGRGAPGADLGDALSQLPGFLLPVLPLLVLVGAGLVLAAAGRRGRLATWFLVLLLAGIGIEVANAVVRDDLGLMTLRNSLPLLVTLVAAGAWLHRAFDGARLIVIVAVLAGLVASAPLAWHQMKHYRFQNQEQAFARAIETGEDQEGRSSIGGFRVGIEPERRMAAYIKRNVPGRDAVLTDNAQTFGVIALTGRPQAFLDRVDRGDDRFRAVLDRPYGSVRYLLATTADRSDLVTRRYPRLNEGREAGLTPVYRTERYVLARVDATAPRPARRPGAAGTATGAGNPAGGAAGGAVGGDARSAEESRRR